MISENNLRKGIMCFILVFTGFGIGVCIPKSNPVQSTAQIQMHKKQKSAFGPHDHGNSRRNGPNQGNRQCPPEQTPAK